MNAHAGECFLCSLLQPQGPGPRFLSSAPQRQWRAAPAASREDRIGEASCGRSAAHGPAHSHRVVTLLPAVQGLGAHEARHVVAVAGREEPRFGHLSRASSGRAQKRWNRGEKVQSRSGVSRYALRGEHRPGLPTDTTTGTGHTVVAAQRTHLRRVALAPFGCERPLRRIIEGGGALVLHPHRLGRTLRHLRRELRGSKQIGALVYENHTKSIIISTIQFYMKIFMSKINIIIFRLI